MAPKMVKPTMTSGAHSAGIFADMTVDGPIIGDLVVVIDRARNLPNRKTMGKQDPYCAARLGKEAKKTDTDRRGGQTPKWDQELRFVVHDSPDYYKLKLSVFNDDRKTDLVGETWIDLKDVVVRGGGQHDGWHNLNCRARPAGEIRMEITYYDTREREERLQEEKAPRQIRESMPASLHNGNVKRRPLPKGPSSNRNSMITLSSGPWKEMTRRSTHAVNDAKEEDFSDPYEHKHRMMATHGVPFDPSAIRKEERRTYNGGPRPAPGQQSFSDLEKLSFRNRGLQLPESPRRGDDLSAQAYRDQPDRPTSHHQPPPPQIPDELFSNATSLSAIHSSREALPNPVDQQYQLEAPHAHQPMHYVQQPNAPFENGSPDFSRKGYDEGHPATTFESQFSPNQHFQPEEDLAPPPPPPHRSNPIRSGDAFPQETSHQHIPAPNSFSQRLADLNRHDDFFRPIESATQLTTHSEPPLGASLGYYADHNHLPPHYERAYKASPTLTAQPKSIQDMRHHVQAGTFEPASTWQYPDATIEADTHIGYPQEAMRGPSPVLAYGVHNGSVSVPHDDVYTESLRQSSQLPQPMLSSDRSAMQARQEELLSSYNQSSDPLTQAVQHIYSEPHEERYSYRSSAPLVKPRAISPNLNNGKVDDRASNTAVERHGVFRKSVSPAPETRRQPDSPRLSGIAFSPESFDVLNPQVSGRRSGPVSDGKLMIANYATAASDGSSPSFNLPAQTLPLQSEDAIESDAPIRDSLGRLIDPSDHLPSSTWAPEPESKTPMRQSEAKLRFRGAVPMPTISPRAHRPSVELPELRSSVQSSYLTESPSSAAQPGERAGRGKLQKKVRVMMTAGARRNERADSAALQDMTNTNGRAGYRHTDSRDPAAGERRSWYPNQEKTPYEDGSEENWSSRTDTYVDGGDTLTREMSNIDLGMRTGARAKRTRFVTTVM